MSSYKQLSNQGSLLLSTGASKSSDKRRPISTVISTGHSHRCSPLPNQGQQWAKQQAPISCYCVLSVNSLWTLWLGDVLSLASFFWKVTQLISWRDLHLNTKHPGQTKQKLLALSTNSAAPCERCTPLKSAWQTGLVKEAQFYSAGALTGKQVTGVEASPR